MPRDTLSLVDSSSLEVPGSCVEEAVGDILSHRESFVQGSEQNGGLPCFLGLLPCWWRFFETGRAGEEASSTQHSASLERYCHRAEGVSEGTPPAQLPSQEAELLGEGLGCWDFGVPIWATKQSAPSAAGRSGPWQCVVLGSAE